MDGHKPKFVTLREYPQVGPYRVRILEDGVTRSRCLDIREHVHPQGLSRYGIRIKFRSDLEFLRDVLGAVLRDPLF
ncbi:MAG: hypothetical protein JO332_02805 [Planctomycetaceae bacterium]|nr:hypothetical protein [Planctomycetaceae bacterium]